MTVTYPDGLVLTQAQHMNLQAQGLDPYSGGWDPKGMEAAQAYHDQNVADAEAAEAALLAEEEGEGPSSAWTVAQLDAYASEHEIADYPSTGNKSEKLAAIEAA